MTFGEAIHHLVVGQINRGFSKEMVREAVLTIIDGIDEEEVFDIDEYIVNKLKEETEELGFFKSMKVTAKLADGIYAGLDAMQGCSKYDKMNYINKFLENRKEE